MLEASYDESTNTYTATYPVGATSFEFQMSKPVGSHWGTSVESATYGRSGDGTSSESPTTKSNETKYWSGIDNEPGFVVVAIEMTVSPAWVMYEFYTNRDGVSATTTVLLTQATE